VIEEMARANIASADGFERSRRYFAAFFDDRVVGFQLAHSSKGRAGSLCYGARSSAGFLSYVALIFRPG
jgi:hypothetical protein